MDYPPEVGRRCPSQLAPGSLYWDRLDLPIINYGPAEVVWRGAEKRGSVSG
jgi:hypothetical protein